MTDQSQAINKAESADTSQEPMPSSEQTPSSDEKSSSDITPEESTASQDEGSLPEGVKERTTLEFEKLKTQLREEKERRLRAERVSQLYGTTQDANQQLYQSPADTGYQTEDERITRAEQMAKQAYYQAQRIIKENDAKQESVAYKAHPELDPNKKEFNENYQKAVIGYLASVMAEGKSMTLKEAASMVKSFSKVDLKKAQEKGATQAIESLTPKEQASLEATGRSDRRRQVGDLEQLRERTRTGDQQAIIERLKNIPIVGK